MGIREELSVELLVIQYRQVLTILPLLFIEQTMTISKLVIVSEIGRRLSKKKCQNVTKKLQKMWKWKLSSLLDR